MLIVIAILTALFPGTMPTALLHQLESQANCSGNTIACGPGTSCCPSGYICNFNRGIPACEDPSLPIVSGFNGPPCADPYLYNCASLVGIAGYCCPIGTVCFNDGVDHVVSCIDAYGTTASSYPSATLSVVPSSTPVAADNSSIMYNPASAWSDSNSVPNCTSSRSLRITSTINSTVSFEYTGPSIMIHTVTSSQGGVFAVFVDGFNTTSTIDTFSGTDTPLPLCYPVQFPPFRIPPPTLATQNQHSIMLLYKGPSPKAPNGTTSGNVQFDAFAIPEFQSSHSHSSAIGKERSSLISFTVGIASLTICLLVGCFVI